MNWQAVIDNLDKETKRLQEIALDPRRHPNDVQISATAAVITKAFADAIKDGLKK